MATTHSKENDPGQPSRDRELEVHEVQPTSPDQTNAVAEEKPYSIFTLGEKWTIVCIASLGGLFRFDIRLLHILLLNLISALC